MYNKPITQRVAFARGKKASALKQTEDNTVLKKEIPTVTETANVALPDTITKETITIPGGLTGKKDEEQMSNQQWKEYLKNETPEQKARRNKREVEEGLKEADTIKEIETVVPGGEGEAEVPLYQYDKGDSMPSWMQRKYYRGLKVGERQQKKALKSQLKEGAISKEQYEKGLKGAATMRANASKAFATTQAEAARQGQMFGKTGTTMIPTFDPNVSISGEGPVGRAVTAADTDFTAQKIKAQEEAKRLAAEKARLNQEAAKNKENEPSPLGMKVGPLKMKSAFKMGGYGNKTYKK